MVDTAPGYKDSEEVVGRALAGGLRSRVILSTKYYPYGEGDRLDLSGDRMSESLTRSLSRLGTDHVDILHLHWVHSPADILAIASSELASALRKEREKENGGKKKETLAELKQKARDQYAPFVNESVNVLLDMVTLSSAKPVPSSLQAKSDMSGR